MTSAQSVSTSESDFPVLVRDQPKLFKTILLTGVFLVLFGGFTGGVLFARSFTEPAPVQEFPAAVFATQDSQVFVQVSPVSTESHPVQLASLAYVDASGVPSTSVVSLDYEVAVGDVVTLYARPGQAPSLTKPEPMGFSETLVFGVLIGSVVGLVLAFFADGFLVVYATAHPRRFN